MAARGAPHKSSGTSEEPCPKEGGALTWHSRDSCRQGEGLRKASSAFAGLDSLCERPGSGTLTGAPICPTANHAPSSRASAGKPRSWERLLKIHSEEWQF